MALIRPKLDCLVRSLLEWYRGNARDLPWRRTTDPYAIWVSEVMLQQTQVKTVLEFWTRWMRQLPNVSALAGAEPDRVLKLWEGLGYYRRARNLQQAARIVRDQHGGAFPDRFEDILQLPGIGRYTAGAICSIAFDVPTPILDGNVMRVLTRVMGIRQGVGTKAVRDQLWGLSAKLVQCASELGRVAPFAADASAGSQQPSSIAGRHGAGQTARGALNHPVEQNVHEPDPATLPPRPCADLNQGLMELGAMVCKPRAPLCEVCPWRSVCACYRSGLSESIPNLGKRITPIKKRTAALVIERNGRWLVRRRPEGEVNGRLWEFPSGEIETGEICWLTAARNIMGIPVTSSKPIARLRHSITRYRITLEVLSTTLPSRLQRPRALGDWRQLSELVEMPFSSAHRRILKALVSASPNRAQGALSAAGRKARKPSLSRSRPKEDVAGRVTAAEARRP